MGSLPELAASLQNDEYRTSVHKILGELLINVVNKAFKDQTVVIDGYRFINCLFDNCTFVINRGTFELHNCQLGIKMFYFGEEAQKTIQLLQLSGSCNACSNIPQFMKPRINADGTVSIGKGISL